MQKKWNTEFRGCEKSGFKTTFSQTNLTTKYATYLGIYGILPSDLVVRWTHRNQALEELVTQSFVSKRSFVEERRQLNPCSCLVVFSQPLYSAGPPDLGNLYGQDTVLSLYNTPGNELIVDLIVHRAVVVLYGVHQPVWIALTN